MTIGFFIMKMIRRSVGGNGGLSIRSKQGSIDAIKITKDLIEKIP
jgi:hypothetical protein